MNELQTYLVDAYSLGASCFLFYWLFNKSKGLKTWFQKNFAFESGELTHWMVSKYLGFILMGGLAGLYVLTQHPMDDIDMLGLGAGNLALNDVFIISGLAIVALTITYAGRSSPHLFSNYPEVSITIWNSRQVYYYLFAWVVYIMGYEILFRGVLLISIAPILGNEPALVLSVVIYTMAHLDKSTMEVFGSLIFGATIGYYCLEVGSIYPAIILHLIISLRSNYYAIANNPDIQWEK